MLTTVELVMEPDALSAEHEENVLARLNAGLSPARVGTSPELREAIG
jgi:hypothetical protein